MKLSELQIGGIRCFAEPMTINPHDKCNVFVGKNNSGKTTLLRSILTLQGFPFDNEDIRASYKGSSYIFYRFKDVKPGTTMNLNLEGHPNFSIVKILRSLGTAIPSATKKIDHSVALFVGSRPSHCIVPFLAKRKATSFDQNVSLGPQSTITGTLSALYSRIDLLATAGHPDHEKFKQATQEIIGLPITTKASGAGKIAGFYIDRNNFVQLERMGDGVSEMIALIVELCIEQDKIFILEEPETNLHPLGLKRLLGLVREASSSNQFFISTHSNIVVRELGDPKDGRVFRVARADEDVSSPSIVEEVDNTAQARTELLKELGYEFADLHLFEAWLFLEESSAERIIRDVLIPNFVPTLAGKLRTYSAGGVEKVEPSIDDFQRLMTFVHLSEVYHDRMFVRVDGDQRGQTVVEKLKTRFPRLNDEHLAAFSLPQIEHYYPSVFADKVSAILGITDRKRKMLAKNELLTEVLGWTAQDLRATIPEWRSSAKELIELLRLIERKISQLVATAVA